MRRRRALAALAAIIGGTLAATTPAHAATAFSCIGTGPAADNIAPGVEFNVAFNGKRSAQEALGRKGATLAFGLQPELLAGAGVFVLPSTAGLASGHWSIEPWKQLAMAVTGTTAR